MQQVILYRYRRPDGGVTISPDKPDCEYTTLTRLIADEGKDLTRDGTHRYSCIDTTLVEGWYEIDALEPEESELPADI